MDYVGSLRAKRSEIWAQLEQLRQSRRELDERIAVRESQLRNIDELLALEGEGNGQRTNGPVSPAHFMDAAVDELQNARAGLHHKQILQRIIARGVNVPGRDPSANLIAHMSRDPRVVRVGRGTYAIAGSAPGKPPVRRRRSTVARR